jgi:hypothetical protein
MERPTRVLIKAQLSIIAGVIAVVIGSSSSVLAGTVNVKGSGSYTGIPANFSFDGTAHPGNPTGGAAQLLLAGSDNIGGPFTGENIGEYSLNFSTSCTAPDGTAGIGLELVKAVETVTYNQGELYSSAVGPGSGCISLSPPNLYVLSETHIVFGGTGKFANASGTITFTQTGRILDAGTTGVLTGASITETGSLTD